MSERLTHSNSDSSPANIPTNLYNLHHQGREAEALAPTALGRAVQVTWQEGFLVHPAGGGSRNIRSEQKDENEHQADRDGASSIHIEFVEAIAQEIEFISRKISLDV